MTAALTAQSGGDIVPTMKFVQNYGTTLGIALMALAIGLGALEPAAALPGRIARGVAAIGLLALAGVIFWQQRRNVRRRDKPR
jgi:putative Ca2+/H+ antiporter (TMEM165/GDT1 family)